jgi:hypothetical protein
MGAPENVDGAAYKRLISPAGFGFIDRDIITRTLPVGGGTNRLAEIHHQGIDRDLDRPALDAEDIGNIPQTDRFGAAPMLTNLPPDLPERLRQIEISREEQEVIC